MKFIKNSAFGSLRIHKTYKIYSAVRIDDDFKSVLDIEEFFTK